MMKMLELLWSFFASRYVLRLVIRTMSIAGLYNLFIASVITTANAGDRYQFCDAAIDYARINYPSSLSITTISSKKRSALPFISSKQYCEFSVNGAVASNGIIQSSEANFSLAGWKNSDYDEEKNVYVLDDKLYRRAEMASLIFMPLIKAVLTKDHTEIASRVDIAFKELGEGFSDCLAKYETEESFKISFGEFTCSSLGQNAHYLLLEAFFAEHYISLYLPDRAKLTLTFD